MSILTIQESCIHFIQINHLFNYQIFHKKIFTFLKTFNSEFSYFEVWFTVRNSKPLLSFILFSLYFMLTFNNFYEMQSQLMSTVIDRR